MNIQTENKIERLYNLIYMLYYKRAELKIHNTTLIFVFII